MTEQQDFLTKLRDPEEHDIISVGINRTLEYYGDTFHKARYFEVPRKQRDMRTWRIIFDTEFRSHLPSLHIENDLKHNFKRGEQSGQDIHVTVNSFGIESKSITIFVTRWDKR